MLGLNESEVAKKIMLQYHRRLRLYHKNTKAEKSIHS